MNRAMSNAELREAIDQTAARLQQDGFERGTRRDLADHLEHLLKVEQARAASITWEGEGYQPAGEMPVHPPRTR
ncbi:hypothetical protein [Halomonas salina]|uniref:Uncharacterized protein n=1 Tax=Halomonas salina TaxID=42565 RepID=A0ABR4WU68_9GAMM|nr:hypothetical protein [Halomonas salina]KGE78266.1 hypothetical protein FP66_04530 [Halomonas salina]